MIRTGPIPWLLLAAPLPIAAGTPFCDHAGLEALLRQADVLSPDRRLIHLSHSCDLVIEGRAYPVLDLRELVQGAVVPRGYNRLAVLTGKGEVLAVIEYGNARPLFCRGASLFLFGDIAVGNLGPEGNVLTFGADGSVADVGQVDPNAYPD